jgi:hypothetical protein
VRDDEVDDLQERLARRAQSLGHRVRGLVVAGAQRRFGGFDLARQRLRGGAAVARAVLWPTRSLASIAVVPS